MSPEGNAVLDSVTRAMVKGQCARGVDGASARGFLPLPGALGKKHQVWRGT